MKRCCSLAALVVGVVVVGGAPVPCALAQTPGQVGAGQPVTSAFLDKRVPEELATEGVVLSRQGFALKVEQVGTVWLASLVDLNTGRVAASTKLDALPADREAAVATMTQVVADLAAQVTGRTSSAPGPDAPVKASDLADFAAREETRRAVRDTAETSYRRHAIHFGTEVNVSGGSDGDAVTSSLSSIPYQGDLNQRMSPDEFFTTIHRPDLVASYKTRRNWAIAVFVVAGAAALTGTSLLLFTDPTKPADPSCFPCSGGMSSTAKAGIGFTLSAIGLVGVGLFVGVSMNPASEAQMKTLADDYNQQLRKQLGLPVVSRRDPILRDLRLAPVMASSGGGLALGGRF